MDSPGFSKFRSLMDVWDTYLLEQENEDALKHIIDGHGLILFFKKDGEYFGTGEDGRIVFARIKNPDDDTPDGWEEEASFTACNLSKMVRGEPSQHVIDHDSIKKIKVVDKDEVIEKLRNDATDSGQKLSGIKNIRFGVMTRNHDRDEAPNFTRADEE